METVVLVLSAMLLVGASVVLTPEASARCLVGPEPDCLVQCPTSGCVPCSPGGWCCWSCQSWLWGILA